MRTVFDIARDSLDKVGHAQLTSVSVNGNRATTKDSSGGSPTEWEKVNGRWVASASPDGTDGTETNTGENGTSTTATTTTITTSPTSPAPTPSPAATDPGAVITQHFEDLNSGDYQGAFKLLTANYQSRNPSWVSDRQAAAPRINVISIGTPQYVSSGAQVPVDFYTRDRNATPGSDTKCRQFKGTVHMVKESGEWRYDPSGSSLNATVVASTNPNCPS